MLNLNVNLKLYEVKLKRIVTIFLLVFLISGCGYHMGNMGNPQIETIGIAPVQNDTYFPDASQYMRQALAEKFQFDGNYKVTDIKDSDAILYGIIKEVETTAADIRTETGGVTFMTQTFSINITFKFTVVIPGKKDPFIPSTVITKSAEYSVPIDHFISKKQGLRQASARVAKEVVWNCTERW